MRSEDVATGLLPTRVPERIRRPAETLISGSIRRRGRLRGSEPGHRKYYRPRELLHGPGHPQPCGYEIHQPFILSPDLFVYYVRDWTCLNGVELAQPSSNEHDVHVLLVPETVAL